MRARERAGSRRASRHQQKTEGAGVARDGTIITCFRKIIGGNTNSELSERRGKRGTKEADEGTEKGVGFQRHG